MNDPVSYIVQEMYIQAMMIYRYIQSLSVDKTRNYWYGIEIDHSLILNYFIIFQQKNCFCLWVAFLKHFKTIYKARREGILNSLASWKFLENIICHWFSNISIYLESNAVNLFSIVRQVQKRPSMVDGHKHPIEIVTP